MDRARVTAFAARHHGVPARTLRVDVAPLRGGLEAAGIARVDVRRRAWPGWLISRFVVKRLSGPERREADVYRTVERLPGPPLAPRVLGHETVDEATSYLYLEHVSAWRRWPWAEFELAARTLEQLARIHRELPPPADDGSWNYERELRHSAQLTADFVARQARVPGRVADAAAVRRVGRLTRALPDVRRTLLASGCTALHGDAHPGNAIVARRQAIRLPLLLDWTRARSGSPLEDVSSWLQSLGFWEGEARRSHDALLRRYLTASAGTALVTRELRDLYWLAAACNGLAGALRYHLWAAYDDPAATPARRATAERAARDWLRVMRRALECWQA